MKGDLTALGMRFLLDGLERNPDEFRRPQRSTESGAGMQRAGGAAAGPVGPGLGPGLGQGRARAFQCS